MQCQTVENILLNHCELLEEYFSIQISVDGTLGALPMILPGYDPDLVKLPLFLLRLALEVCQ